MRELRTRQRVKGFIFSVPVALLLLLVFVFLARSTWQVYGKKRAAEDALERSRAEETELVERKATLEREIQSLRTPEGIEAEIRGTFNMARPGEELIIIVEDDNVSGADDPRRGFWARIRSFFDSSEGE